MKLTDGTTISPEQVDFIKKQYGHDHIVVGKMTLFIKEGMISTLPGSYQIIAKDGGDFMNIKKLHQEIVSRFNPKAVNLHLLSLTGNIIPGCEPGYLASVVHQLLEANPNEVLGFFDKKTRNQTRRGIDAGFSLSRLIKTGQFYPLYCASITRLANRPKNEKYFDNLFNCFGKNLTVTGAFKGKKLVGGNIYITNGYYSKLMFNFSDPYYWSDYVNNFLYYDLYRQSVEKKIKILDLGPSPINDKSHLNFKLGFGGQKMPISVFTWERNAVMNIYKATRRYFGRKILGL